MISSSSLRGFLVISVRVAVAVSWCTANSVSLGSWTIAARIEGGGGAFLVLYFCRCYWVGEADRQTDEAGLTPLTLNPILLPPLFLSGIYFSKICTACLRKKYGHNEQCYYSSIFVLWVFYMVHCLRAYY